MFRHKLIFFPLIALLSFGHNGTPYLFGDTEKEHAIKQQEEEKKALKAECESVAKEISENKRPAVGCRFGCLCCWVLCSYIEKVAERQKLIVHTAKSKTPKIVSIYEGLDIHLNTPPKDLSLFKRRAKKLFCTKKEKIKCAKNIMQRKNYEKKRSALEKKETAINERIKKLFDGEKMGCRDL